MADDKTPKHYLNKKGQDLFDEWHDRVSMDVMREIMRFTSDRYVRRYDRKNGIEDLEKGINVLERLKEYEIAEEEKKTTISKALAEHLESFEKEDDSMDKVSDGYHTFDELYYHRMVLFSLVCNANPDKAWKSKQHHDGTMFDDTSFICGIETPEGQYTYHYHLDYWDNFKVKELEFAPEWDGHTSMDIRRLLSLEAEK